MKKQMLMLAATLFASHALFAETALKTGSAINQGVDCELFLNPFVELEIKDLSHQVMLDAGCGLAAQSIIAAKNGAQVYAFTPEKQLLEMAKTAISQTGLQSQINLSLADFNQLPYEANTFDKAFLINTMENHSLSDHFNELARVVKAGGQLMVAAPASYATLFTDGTQPDNVVRRHISQVLSKIGKSSDSALITKQLSELKEVMRATFVKVDGVLRLVTSEKMLKKGEPVWCKMPEGVISTTYHSEEEYLVAMNQAGLHCQEIKRPCFFGRVKYNMWHEKSGKSLGDAYLMNHPFTIYYLIKKA